MVTLLVTCWFVVAEFVDKDGQQLNEGSLHRRSNAIRAAAGVRLNQQLINSTNHHTTRRYNSVTTNQHVTSNATTVNYYNHYYYNCFTTLCLGLPG